MNRKYAMAAATVLLLAAVSVGAIRWGVRTPEVRFSETEAFQEEAFDLTLSGGLLGGTIYYTLDGSDPTLDSEIYTGPIRIEEGMPLSATVVKAAALEAGTLGDVYTQTYFVGEGVDELFDVMVVSLTADQEALYDPETGILANYTEKGENGEWDRQAYIEFYESDGSLMLKQGTGIAVSGNGSRTYDQKSIKLIASSEYDMDHPTFDYDFFDTDMAGNTTGQSYNRLVLRNGGTDHEGTMIKWNVVSRLAREAGIVCAGARPGILFLNGEYYGIIQLQEKYTAYNVASAIGAQKDDIEKYEPNEVNSSRFGGYYNRLHSDLNDPERQEKLEESVDMPDMLRHYAVNLIMNNVDWPFHNFLSWKCAEGSASAYGDGRVRFFLYDLDAVYQDTSDLETQNSFDSLMDEPIEDMTDTLSLLMQSDKYRTQFVNLVCDLTSTVYDEDHVLQIIDEENEKIARSMALYYTEAERQRQSGAVAEMKAMVSESCSRVREGLKTHLGAEDPYVLTVEAPEGTEISFSRISLSGGESYTGTYYHNYPLTLTASGADRYHWLVNGVRTDAQELLLDESMTGDAVEIRLVAEE
ncbi:MAG: CotH kinase family protein [Eubacteriales bacterium]|nr:CotH kinase family protein [Eubacteriales bacterium]